MPTFLAWFSAVSFLGYGLSCLFAARMLAEFERFGLARQRVTVGSFQLLGAGGLIAGFWYPIIGQIAAGGLALQMLLGVGVRLKIRDSLLQTLPAVFYLVLNSYLFAILLQA